MKTNSLKRIFAFVCSLVFVLSSLTSAVCAATPRYKDILFVDCGMDITNSIAECRIWAVGKALNNEYRVTMVLYQDDNDFATWTYSEIGEVDAVETCYVTQGHEYYVGIYVAVYDPNGNFIEDVIAYTGTYYY